MGSRRLTSLPRWHGNWVEEWSLERRATGETKPFLPSLFERSSIPLWPVSLVKTNSSSDLFLEGCCEGILAIILSLRDDFALTFHLPDGIFGYTPSLSWLNCQDCGGNLTTSSVHPAGPIPLTRQLSDKGCYTATDKTFLAGDWKGKKKIKRRMERGDKERFLPIDFFANEKSLKNHFLAAALRCMSCYAEGGRTKIKLWVRSNCDLSFIWTGSHLGKQKIRNSNKRKREYLR